MMVRKITTIIRDWNVRDWNVRDWNVRDWNVQDWTVYPCNVDSSGHSRLNRIPCFSPGRFSPGTVQSRSFQSRPFQSETFQSETFQSRNETSRNEQGCGQIFKCKLWAGMQFSLQTQLKLIFNFCCECESQLCFFFIFCKFNFIFRRQPRKIQIHLKN